MGADQKIAAIDAMLRGARIRYNAAFTDALREENRVTGVVWMENGERHTARAKFVIDCTGIGAPPPITIPPTFTVFVIAEVSLYH